MLAAYHRTSLAYAAAPTPALHNELDRLQHELDASGGWQIHQRVDRVLARMELPPDAISADLSAGMKRRVLLARRWWANPTF